MRVLITGGTGLVGSHACRALQRAGHKVRLLVRNTEKAHNFYTALDEPLPECVTGDVTDRNSLVSALAGCEGLVHAAAATPMQIGSIEQLFAVNVVGVENVVGEALAAGVSRIVCLSSITAIFNRDAGKVTPDAPPTPSKMPYGRSKLEAELYLRGLQARGAPVAIVYPGGILGPDDPGFSDSCKAIKHRIDNGFRIFGNGGMQYIDVRDLADFIRSLIEDGGNGRYLLPGVFSTWTEQADLIEDVSGARLQRIPAQGWKLRLVGKLMDVARHFRKIDSPVSAETMRYATLWPEIPNTDELARRGLALRPPRETFADTLRWMVKAGYLDAATCPKSA